MADDGRHLCCPECGAYTVDRLYVATVRMDSCECHACGHSWDEDPSSGRVHGCSDPESVLVHRDGR
ncbi:MAG: hypothetical protein HYX34_13150 [Actinobacteria bacterium]|nr:hypothetical protein [Actinomycetota bacterium]